MGPDGRLLAIEAVIGPPNAGAAGKFTDLTMLANPGGRERTREEYAALVGAAGFRLSGVVPTTTEHSVIEAMPT
jgi:hypothetical protein